MKGTRLLAFVCVCGLSSLDFVGRSVSAANNAPRAAEEFLEPRRSATTLRTSESSGLQEVAEPLIVREHRTLLGGGGRSRRSLNPTTNGEDDHWTNLKGRNPSEDSTQAGSRAEDSSRPAGRSRVHRRRRGDPVKRRKDALPRVLPRHLVQPLSADRPTGPRYGPRPEIVKRRIRLESLASQTGSDVRDIETAREAVRHELGLDTSKDEGPPAELSEDQVRDIGESLDKRLPRGGRRPRLPATGDSTRDERRGARHFKRQLEDYDQPDEGPVHEVSEETLKDIEKSLDKRIERVRGGVSRRCKQGRPAVQHRGKEDKPGDGKHSPETVDLMHRILSLLRHEGDGEDCDDDDASGTKSPRGATGPEREEFMSSEGEHVLEDLNASLSNRRGLRESPRGDPFATGHR